MYGDEKISVEAYCDRLKTQMLSVLNVLSLHLHITQNEAMMSAHVGEPPEKCMHRRQDVQDMSIFSCNKKIFVARQK